MSVAPPPGFQSMPLLVPQTQPTRTTNGQNRSTDEKQHSLRRTTPSPQLPVSSSSARPSTRDRYTHKQPNKNTNNSTDDNQNTNTIDDDSLIVRSASGARYEIDTAAAPVVNSHQSTNTSTNHKYDIEYLLSLRNTNTTILQNILPDVSKNGVARDKWSHETHGVRMINEPRQRHNSHTNDSNERRWVDNDRDKWHTRNENKQQSERRYNQHLPRTYDENAPIEWADEIPNTDFNFDFSSAVLDRTADIQQAKRMGIKMIDTNAVTDDLSTLNIQSTKDLEAEKAAFKAKLAAEKEKEKAEMLAELAEVQLDIQPNNTNNSNNNNNTAGTTGNQPVQPNTKLANFLFMGGEDKFGAFSHSFNKSNVPTAQTAPQPIVQQPIVQPTQTAAPMKMGADAFFKMFSGPSAVSQPATLPQQQLPVQQPTLQPQPQQPSQLLFAGPKQPIQQPVQQQQPSMLPYNPTNQYGLPGSMLQQQQAQHLLNQQRQQQIPQPYQPQPQQYTQSYNQPIQQMQQQQPEQDDGTGMNRLLNKARARKQVVQPIQPVMTPAAAAQRLPITYSNLPQNAAQQYNVQYQQQTYGQTPNPYNYAQQYNPQQSQPQLQSPYNNYNVPSQQQQQYPPLQQPSPHAAQQQAISYKPQPITPQQQQTR